MTGQGRADAQKNGVGIDSSLSVVLYADILNGAEGLRMASEQRLLKLITDKGYPEGGPEAVELRMMCDDLALIEKRAVGNLTRAMKLHPLGPWVERTPGIGEKGVARLIGVLGNLERFPRVSSLWHYSGMHVVGGQAPRRREGEKLTFNPKARTRLYVIVEAAYRQGHYRPMYVAAREKLAEAVHGEAGCSGEVRMGKTPATKGLKRRYYCKREDGERAGPGDPLSAGHQHSRAMRLVGKEILKDMWVEWHRPGDR